jgi:hypothetical protein
MVDDGIKLADISLIFPEFLLDVPLLDRFTSILPDRSERIFHSNRSNLDRILTAQPPISW